MENKVYSREACKALLQYHHDSIKHLHKNNLLITKHGCLNISSTIEDVKNQSVTQMAFQLQFQAEENLTFHLFDDSTDRSCPCLEELKPVTEYQLIPNSKEVSVFQQFSLQHNLTFMVTIHMTKPLHYTAVIHFEKSLVPRLLGLQNILHSLTEGNSIIKRILQNNLGLINTSETIDAMTESEEFMFVTTTPNLVKIFHESQHWNRLWPRCINNKMDFYKPKEKHDQRRRLVLHQWSVDQRSWTCVIQYQAHRLPHAFSLNHKLIIDSIKPKFKKELLLRSSSCAIISAAAEKQQIILNAMASKCLEADILLQQGQDRIFVLEGQWKGLCISDGEEWKNNSSTVQKEVLQGTTTPPKVTTFIPRDRANTPTSSEPLLKKEHVIMNNTTIIYYHVQNKAGKPSIEPPYKRLKKLQETPYEETLNTQSSLNIKRKINVTLEQENDIEIIELN